jgi:hypothetical protein
MKPSACISKDTKLGEKNESHVLQRSRVMLTLCAGIVMTGNRNRQAQAAFRCSKLTSHQLQDHSY